NTSSGDSTSARDCSSDVCSSDLFKVNDGTVDSAPATVSLTVTAVNDAPVANNQSVTVTEDTPQAIVLTGSDVDGDPLTFAIVNRSEERRVGKDNSITGAAT